MAAHLSLHVLSARSGSSRPSPFATALPVSARPTGLYDPKGKNPNDESIHKVLGHHLKDFEGEISAKNLGSIYGGYGSFLPVYRHSPSALSKKKTPQKVESHNKLPISILGINIVELYMLDIDLQK
ncbi:hypothetical protein NMG60_11020760 [Bertholletia excelsa]